MLLPDSAREAEFMTQAKRVVDWLARFRLEGSNGSKRFLTASVIGERTQVNIQSDDIGVGENNRVRELLIEDRRVEWGAIDQVGKPSCDASLRYRPTYEERGHEEVAQLQADTGLDTVRNLACTPPWDIAKL